MVGQRKTSDGRYVLRTGEYEKKDQAHKGGFIYRFKDTDGKRTSISAATLKELREKEKEVQKTLALGVSVAQGRYSLDAHFEKWKGLKRGLRARTISSYYFHYNKYARPRLGSRQIADIKYSDMKKFYNDLVEEDGLSVLTATIVHTVLMQIFELAVKDEVIRYNPAKGAISELKRAHPHVKKHSLTPREQVLLQETIQDTMWEPLLMVMLRTGLRIGEVAGLTWEDIDFENNLLHVRHNLQYYYDSVNKCTNKVVNETKTNAGLRDLPLSEELKELFLLQKKNGPKCKDNINGVTGFVFSSRQNGTISQSMVNGAIRRLVKKQNEASPKEALPSFSCHELRRTFATNCVRAGVDIITLMHWMGHTSSSVTLGYYVEVQADMSQIQSEKVRDYIDELVKSMKGK